MGKTNQEMEESKKDYAYRMIKNMILSHELKENTFANERDFSEKLDISRTPIKAALGQLAQEGLVVNYPRKGYLITSVTSRDVREIYEIRCSLDVLAFRSVVETMPEIRKKMIKECDAMEFAIKNEEYKEAEAHDVNFHKLYIDNVKNKRLEEIEHQLWDQSERFILKTHFDAGRMQKAVQEHKEIAELLKNKEFAQACNALEQHLKSSCEYHLNIL